jgi:hypothetical protein
MIADAVYFAVAGLGFCHAAGRSIFSRGFPSRMTTLLPQNWIKRCRRFRGRNPSLIKKS